MFRHIVCFRLQEAKKEYIEEAKQKLLSLKAIPEVKSVEVGLDVLKNERSYDIVLIVDFENKAAYKVYDEHELHQPVRAFMKNICEASITVDFDRDK